MGTHILNMSKDWGCWVLLPFQRPLSVFWSHSPPQATPKSHQGGMELL